MPRQSLRGRAQEVPACARHDLRRACAELRISEASVKRMFSRSSFTLSRIEEILAALDLDLHEVARMSLASAAGPAELTLDQETALAKDERLISVFWLVLNGWRYEQIAESLLDFARRADPGLCAIGPAQAHRMGQRREGAAARSKDFQWRAGGPVKKAYGRRVIGEFLEARFDSPLELLRFETRQLSPSPRGAKAAPGEAGGRVQ